MSNSPYQPPIQGETYSNLPPQMNAAPARPTSVTVLAILSIAFGLLGFFGGLLSLAVLSFVDDPQVPNPLREGGPYGTFIMVSSVLGLIVAVLLAVAGFLMLAMKKPGRTLALAYSYYAFVMVAITTFFTIVYALLPAIQAGMDTPEQVGAVVGNVFALVFGLLGLIFPACLIFFLTRPNVKQAFERAAAQQ